VQKNDNSYGIEGCEVIKKTLTIRVGGEQEEKTTAEEWLNYRE
jgi:hypothetical protein